MKTAEKITYGADKAGCWFDNCRGFYLGEAIISEAIAHGFAIEDETQTEIDAAERYADLDFYLDLWQEADDFMCQFAGDGFWFGSNENGDWGLWPSEEDETEEECNARVAAENAAYDAAEEAKKDAAWKVIADAMACYPSTIPAEWTE